MKLFLFLSFLIGLSGIKGETSICNLPSCKEPAELPSPLTSYCHKMNMTENRRCCVNSTAGNFTAEDIIGVDLRKCSLQNVTGLFKDMTSLFVIALEENPELESVGADDFYQLSLLDFISLPADKKKAEECPGGNSAWEISDVVNSTVVCQHQVDTCNTTQNNETCPTPESYCTPAGPGLVDCFCSPGYHGYKCLRQGTFPLVPFVGGICGSTVVLAAFLWVTQRRHVKKQS